MLNLLIDDAIVSAETLFAPLGTTTLSAGKQLAQQARQQSVDALIIRSRTQITEDLLTNCPSIRFIGSSVVGLDHIDQQACERHGVTFYSAQGCNARSVAEYVISHLVTQVAEEGRCFTDITLGIVGVGQVGKRVAQMAQSLGMRCLLNDPPRAEVEADFPHTDLSDLLTQADMITFHTPLTHTGKHPSYHLITAQTLSLVKPKALIINAARGGVIDEACLLDRTDLSLIIDCWENEPLCRPQLLTLSKRATPHIAGHAIDAKYRGGQMTAQALADWLGKDYQAPDLRLSLDELPEIQLTHPEAEPIHQLADLLQQCYDFAQDDRLLRTTLANTPNSFAQVFEDYRRHYPARYEWQHFSIPQGVTTQTHKWLTDLGWGDQPHSAK